jgi:hypothetical protein
VPERACSSSGAISVSRKGASTSRILDHCLDEWNTPP